MTFRSFIRDGGVDKKGVDIGPKFCVGLIVSNGEQGVRCACGKSRCHSPAHVVGYRWVRVMSVRVCLREAVRASHVS